MAADLFTSVMDHAAKYSHVTTPQGAFAFNQAFEDPVLMEEKTKPPQVHVEIIDAVQSEEKCVRFCLSYRHDFFNLCPKTIAPLQRLGRR